MEPRVLEFEVTGDGAETLVLLPGGLTGWQSWRPLVPALAAEHRVVNVQLFSNAEGIAGRPGQPGYTAEFERDNVRLTVQEAGVAGRFHLAGWSNGGRAALDYAIAYPQQVRSVTVIEPAAWWLLGDGEDAAAFGEFITGVAGRDLTSADVEQFLWRAGLGPEGTDFTALPNWPVWLACRNALSWCVPDMMATAERGIDDLESLTMPLLCVRGTDTSAWLHDVVDVVADRAPDASVLDLPGGHACLLQNPNEFVTALTDHVRQASTTVL